MSCEPASIEIKQFYYSTTNFLFILVDCSAMEYKMLNMSQRYDYLLTNEGSLVSFTGIYETTYDIGDFCIDLVKINLNFYMYAIPCISEVSGVG